MGSRTSVTSTEKLLDIIRRSKGAGKVMSDMAPAAPAHGEPGGARPAKATSGPAKPLVHIPARVAAGWLGSLMAGRKPGEVAVGVDLGHAELRLIKVGRRGGAFEVLAWKTVPFNPDLTDASPELAAILRQALTDICGKDAKADIHASIRSPYAELRLLTIPKVPKNQITNAVQWSAKKEMPIDARTQAFDFEVRGEVTDKGAPKIAVLAYTVPLDELAKTRELFARAGFGANSLTVRPFAVQNLFRTGLLAASPDDNIANLHIGRTLSRIDIFHGGNLVLTRGIKAGMLGMEQALLDALLDDPLSQAEPSALVLDLGEPATGRALTLEDVSGQGPAAPAQTPPPRPARPAAAGLNPESATLAVADPAPVAPSSTEAPAPSLDLSLEALTLEEPGPAPGPGPSLVLESAPGPAAPWTAVLDESAGAVAAPPLAGALVLDEPDGDRLALNEPVESVEPDDPAESPEATEIAWPIQAQAAPQAASPSPPGPGEGEGAAGSRRAPVQADATRLLMSLTQDGSGPKPGEPGFGVAPERVIETIMPAAERLVRQVEMTFKHFRLALGNDPVRMLYISGPLCGSERFVRMLGEQIGMACETFDPLGGTDTFKSAAAQVPLIPTWERLSLYTAFGLAVSDDTITPNLLFTHRQRAAAAKVILANQIIVAAVVVLMLALTGLFGYQMVLYGTLRDELAGRKAEYAAFQPQLDLTALTAASARARSGLDLKRQAADRRAGIAAVAEVCGLTPDNIRLLSLTLDMGKPARPPQAAAPGQPGSPPPGPAAPPAPQAAPPKPVRAMVLEGVVTGPPQFFETSLAGYLVKLRSSPLFADLAVDKRSVETPRGGEDVLRFVVSVTLAQG